MWWCHVFWFHQDGLSWKDYKQLTLLNLHSKILKLAEVKGYAESHSDLEAEDKSLDEQNFSETEPDSFLPPK